MERTRLLSRASELPPKGRVHIKEGDREEGSHLCRKSRLWGGKDQGSRVISVQVLLTWWPAVPPLQDLSWSCKIRFELPGRQRVHGLPAKPWGPRGPQGFV